MSKELSGYEVINAANPEDLQQGKVYIADYKNKQLVEKVNPIPVVEPTKYPASWLTESMDGQEKILDVDFKLMDTNKWYWCKCENCGWEDSSEFSGGGGAIADTGDYHDACCPKCYSTNLNGEPTIEIPDQAGVVAIPFALPLQPPVSSGDTF